MAYLPLVDTMHHVLKAWCIFYWFHFDSQGRWGQKGQNAECSPRSRLSAVPEAFCRQIISRIFLVNVQKQHAKNAMRAFLTHACVCFYFVVRYLAPAPFPSSDSCPASFSFCRILYACGGVTCRSSTTSARVTSSFVCASCITSS